VIKDQMFKLLVNTKTNQNLTYTEHIWLSAERLLVCTNDGQMFVQEKNEKIV